jgi:hypothetical protein
MKGDTMTVRLNGVTVSRATDLGVTRGKLQIQSEGDASVGVSDRRM